jgi:beta-N-acetylhexosaminidase
MAPRAFIAGCSGLRLTPDERAFFRDADPWGFILFKRNVAEPGQVAALTAELRASIGRHAPVLVDQEGGRVQRLGPPNWAPYPAARRLGAIAADDALVRRELVRLGARLIAHDLLALGIDVDCLPVLDVPVEGAHDVIGDRAYGSDPNTIATLGRAAAEGLLAGGVLPVMKHVPGHGRATADSHKALPVVDASLDGLRARDFVPFAVNADLPAAMSAHVVFTAIDPDNPATTSRRVVREVIRGEIGFEGLLMSDDLSMRALKGPFRSRAEAVLSAGCDVVLHCNGVMNEMRSVAEGAAELAGRARRRAEAALARIRHRPEPFDVALARTRLEAALAAAA